LQAPRNRHSQEISWRSNRGLIQNGLDGSSIQRNPFRITPGSASGTQWLGTMSPALPYELPEHTSPFSTTTT
jgi:hypothetical protein